MIDYYALGIILFEIVYRPFNSRDEKDGVLRNLRREGIIFPLDWNKAGVMKNITKQIETLLKHDPLKRTIIKFENQESQNPSNEPPHKRQRTELDKNWGNLG